MRLKIDGSDIIMFRIEGLVEPEKVESRLLGEVEKLLSLGKSKILFDLTDASPECFRGTAAVLAKCYVQIRDAGGQTGFLGPSRRLRGVMEICGLLCFVEAFDDLETAIASFAETSSESLNRSHEN